MNVLTLIERLSDLPEEAEVHCYIPRGAAWPLEAIVTCPEIDGVPWICLVPEDIRTRKEFDPATIAKVYGGKVVE